ncbi:sensor histidine kinase [Dermabacteraceae bacterium P13088]
MALACTYDIAVAILSGGDNEEVLQLIVERSTELTAADTAALILPGMDGSWVVEFCHGEESLIGYTLPDSCPAARALNAQDLDTLRNCRVELPGGWQKTLAFPIPGAAEVAGILVLAYREERQDKHVYAQSLASLAGFCLGMADVQDMRDTSDLTEERHRIARDLHDMAIQELFAVGMQLDRIRQEAHALSGGEALVRQVTESLTGVDQTVTQIRQIVQSLRRDSPSATLSQRLHHEAALAISGLGFSPSMQIDAGPLDQEIDDDLAQDVVAVVRECLANAARHAHASAVAVTVSIFSEGVDRVVRVNVSDNGRGIDPTVTRSSGLSNMRSRARRHNGWVDVLPLDQGTMVSWRATLPAK